MWWLEYPAAMPNSKRVAFVSAFIAVGAAARIVLGNFALHSPVPLYGVLIKVGLSETLTIAIGLALGPIAGLTTGALIIAVSDLFMVAGPWTPFIAAIIGLLGFLAGLVRARVNELTVLRLGTLAVLLTALSELLQNAWVSLFYGIPFSATMISGAPSLVTALVNNTILLTTAGPRMIGLIRASLGGSYV